MSKMQRKTYKSQITRRILTRYFLSLVVFIAFIFISYFFSWFLLTRFTWSATNPWYYFFKVIQALSPVLIVIIILVGILVITYRMFSVPLNYLDEVVSAAEILSVSSGEQIKLSPELEDVQNKLNLIRERALRDTMMAREAEQRKNDLIVYLAHDLKTPLTSVIGYLTLLHDEPDISTALRDRYTGIALNKAERLEDLINEFFDITRFNLTTITLEMERRNLSRMLEQITSEFDPVLAEKDLHWQLAIGENVEILCDPDKLERVFDNLIRNAVNYSYPGTGIFLSMKQLGSQVEICVRNHGKTIPPEKLERIFEQFFRLDSSRSSATGGSGLGLAISKEIVELHGGSIRADSARESITFTVLLPSECKKIV